MRLPFGSEAFFDLFEAYNAALWPAVVGLWMVSVLAAVRLWSASRSVDRWISALLAVHWTWSAILYHLVFFTRINPAAWLFAGVFLLQAALFVRSGLMKGDLTFRPASGTSATFGWILIMYALAYPVINVLEHSSVTRIPTFGLPCPTTVFTAGLLLQASARVTSLVIIPIVWSAIGGSAALLLGVTADYALVVAGVALAVLTLRRPAAFSVVR